MSKTTKSTAAAKPAAPKPAAAKAKPATAATPAPASPAPAAAAPVVAPSAAAAVESPTPVVETAAAPVIAPVVTEAPVVKEQPKPDSKKLKASEETEAFKTKIAESFHALVKSKTGAGLPRPDAVEVSRRQLEYDFAGAPDEIKALIKEALDAATAKKA